MEIVYKLETLVQSFTNFTSTVTYVPGSSTDQIMIATPHYEKMHFPRLWVLNATANDVQHELIIETGRTVVHNEKEGIGKKGAVI